MKGSLVFLSFSFRLSIVATPEHSNRAAFAQEVMCLQLLLLYR